MTITSWNRFNPLTATRSEATVILAGHTTDHAANKTHWWNLRQWWADYRQDFKLSQTASNWATESQTFSRTGLRKGRTLITLLSPGFLPAENFVDRHVINALSLLNKFFMLMTTLVLRTAPILEETKHCTHRRTKSAENEYDQQVTGPTYYQWWTLCFYLMLPNS